MSFTPNRISKRNVFTEEIELDNSSIQRNFDLIAKETNELNDKINMNNIKSVNSNNRFKNQTRFVVPFLFGG